MGKDQCDVGTLTNSLTGTLKEALESNKQRKRLPGFGTGGRNTAKQSRGEVKILLSGYRTTGLPDKDHNSRGGANRQNVGGLLSHMEAIHCQPGQRATGWRDALHSATATFQYLQEDCGCSGTTSNFHSLGHLERKAVV